MADVVSIELLLDPATEDRVRDDWRCLADAGLSSLAAHTSPSNRPHVTLARRLRLDRLDDARSLLGLPASGAGIVLRRWDAADKRLMERARSAESVEEPADPADDLLVGGDPVTVDQQRGVGTVDALLARNGDR